MTDLGEVLEGDERVPGPSARRRVLSHLVVALLAAGVAIAVLGMTSNVQGDVGPGTVSVGVKASGSGSTGVALPPFGLVRASTHVAPVALRVRVDSVDVDQIQRALAGPRPQAAIEREVRDEMGPLLRKFVIRTLGFALVVGAVTGLVAVRRHWTYGVTGAVGGLTGVTILLGAMWVNYDVTAFEEARFTGALERAPAIMQTVQRHVDGFEQLEGRVRVVSDQVAGLYSATELEAEAGQTLILHVSDIHSNPLGLELTQRLAESFAVDAVVDTGDLTSFGLPIESRIIDLLEGIDIPYYLVPGNHDSNAIRETLGAADELTLLDGETVSVGSVRIHGIGDPTFTADNRIDTGTANEIKADEAEEVAEAVERESPDLLAVHDLRQAAELEGGEVDTVIAGHNHKRTEENRNGTLLLTVGSTGATGLGSFMVESAQGYEAQVLRFSGQRLVAVDYVTLSGVSGSFEVDRRVVTEEDRESDDAGSAEDEGGEGAEGDQSTEEEGEAVEGGGTDDEAEPDAPGGAAAEGPVNRGGRAAPGRSGPTGAGS